MKFNIRVVVKSAVSGQTLACAYMSKLGYDNKKATVEFRDMFQKAFGESKLNHFTIFDSWVSDESDEVGEITFNSAVMNSCILMLCIESRPSAD